MIDAKEAARIAFEYVQEVYKADEIPHLSLEEVELSSEGDFWFVTVSFLRPVSKSPIEAMTTGQLGTATYKVLKIQAEGGQVHSMKIRTI